MHTLLLVFEFLGTTELMVIALVALILFGPRKLPEIGRTVGKSIAEFKRASDDFKRTWEFEVELEQRKGALDAPAAAGDAGGVTYGGGGAEADAPADSGAGEFGVEPALHPAAVETVARTPSTFEPDGWTGEPEGAGSWDESAGQVAAAPAASPAASPVAPPTAPAAPQAASPANLAPREGDKEDEINAS
jgi:TatA/E family protein of Tat protein translocase